MKLGLFFMINCIYFCFVVVMGMITCKTWCFSMSLCVYVCGVVEGMYTCETGTFFYEQMYLFLCCCWRYIHIQDWLFWQRLVTDYFCYMFRIYLVRLYLSIFVSIFLHISISRYVFISLSIFKYIALSPYLFVYIAIFTSQVRTGIL